ncbi:hypothetical protein [Marinisporobacter balticus]|uniref:Bacterial PH domain-containing protein n=1 Tax=Marinisporobacter balticus TaxID=2018667 RepID=A0A4R2KC04_9FIRM|nr:hypothetical protein [Marinisporobacter balticus]TCO67736.1 hypothetical protein EV214_1564 [Marinisporobacter balticus]
MIKTYTHNKLSSMYQYLIIAVVIVWIGDSIYNKQYLNVFVGVALIYISFCEKKVFITQEGILIRTKRMKRTKERIIKFSQIQRISVQKRNGKAMFYFAREGAGQKAIVDAENVEQIVAWAKKHNKKIDVYYID